MMVGRWVSFWDCLFLEAMLNFRGVLFFIFSPYLGKISDGLKPPTSSLLGPFTTTSPSWSLQEWNTSKFKCSGYLVYPMTYVWGAQWWNMRVKMKQIIVSMRCPRWVFCLIGCFFLTFSLNHVFLLGKSLCSQIFGMVISTWPEIKGQLISDLQWSGLKKGYGWVITWLLTITYPTEREVGKILDSSWCHWWRICDHSPEGMFCVFPDQDGRLMHLRLLALPFLRAATK